MKVRHRSIQLLVLLIGTLLITTRCRKEVNGISEPEPPVIISQYVSDVYSTRATVKTILKNVGPGSVITFEYGLSVSYGSAVPGVVDPIFNDNLHFKADLISLVKDSTYHFRIKARNAAGISYSQDKMFTAKFGIGEYYGGGFIIYLDSSGEHGLIAAETDQSDGITWETGTNCKKTNVSSTVLGSGYLNTSRLLSILGPGEYPAQICDDLVLNGYDDWFLPSLQEFDCLKKGLTVFDRRYNLNGQFYWTSSEFAESGLTQSCYAWVENIFTGEQRSWDKNDKTPYVRAVRAF